jgi:tRNA A-37 threonylcarbamoyl transferase component Bud32
MRTVFKNYVKKIYFENQVVFANLRMRAKKAYNEKILDQKIQKN